MSNRMNFDQAAQHLGVSVEELQGLVSNQEIRAEHDSGEVYFSRQDLDFYMESRSTEPTVVLSEESSGLLEDDGLELEDFSTDETVLNIEGLLEDEGGSGLLEGESELSMGGVGDETVIDTDELSLDSFDFDEEPLDAGGDELLLAGNTEMQLVRKKPATAMTVLMVLTLLCLLIPAALLMNLMNPGGTFPDWGNHGAVNFMNGLIESIVNSL